MKRCIAFALGFILLLCGCSSFFNREVYIETPHLEQRTVADGDTSALRASNISELKSALLRLVRAGEEESTIRLTGYSGDVQRDLPASILSVSHEPIGAYAVSNITFERTRMLTDYELTIYIDYRRTKEQIDSVQYVTGLSGLQKEITNAITSFQDTLTVSTNYYDHEMTDLDVLFATGYYQNPQYAVGLPQMTYTLYPETGLSRIIEMEFKYSQTAEKLRMDTVAAEIAASAIIKTAPEGLDAPETALWLFNKLCELVAYDTESELLITEGGEPDATASGIYGALCNKLALPAGYALAYKRLCELSDIECMVILGKREGTDHAWNVIMLDGAWYHVDASAADTSGMPDYNYFLFSDETLDYRRTTPNTPPCGSDALSFETIAEKAFPELYEQWLDARGVIAVSGKEE